MVTYCSGTVSAVLGVLAFNLETTWVRFFSLKGSSRGSRTTRQIVSSAISMDVRLHEKPALDDFAMDVVVACSRKSGDTSSRFNATPPLYRIPCPEASSSMRLTMSNAPASASVRYCGNVSCVLGSCRCGSTSTYIIVRRVRGRYQRRYASYDLSVWLPWGLTTCPRP